MLPELAQEYSKYLQVNVMEEMNPIRDVVDDLLTRLEETEAISAMIQNEIEQEDILPDLIKCNGDLKQMEVEVDKMKAFIAHVARYVNMLQTKVVAAEQDFPIHASEGSLSSLFNKFMKLSDSAPTYNTMRSPNTTFEPPEIFETKNFFPNITTTTSTISDDSDNPAVTSENSAS